MFGFDIIEVKMAWRNLLGNKRRSFLTLVVIAIGAASLLFLSGYISFVKIGFGESLRQTSYGDFQIYPKGFRALQDESTNKILFTQDEAKQIADTLYDTLDLEISFINQRLYLAGQISNGAQSSIFMGYGGEVYAETQMKNIEIVEGSLLVSSKPNAIVLGKGLASAMDVKLGTELILQVPQADGYPMAELGEVVGIADFGITEMNNRFVIADLRLAQMLNDGAGTQRMLVHFDTDRPWGDVYQDAIQALNDAAATTSDFPQYELATWRDLADFYAKVITLYSNQLYIFSGIFLLMFFFSISNSLYMSIMERQSEIGTLRAVGISRGEIVRVIFLEGFILGIFGFICGLILCVLAQVGLTFIEIIQPPPPGLTEGVRLMILISGRPVLVFGLLTLIIGAFATIPPSWKAVHKNIVDAIRTI